MHKTMADQEEETNKNIGNNKSPDKSQQQYPSPQQISNNKSERIHSNQRQGQQGKVKRSGQHQINQSVNVKQSAAGEQHQHQSSSSPSSSSGKTNTTPNNNKKYAVKKRPLPKEVPTRPNDIFISEKSSLHVSHIYS
jgi:hypothetical protein